MKKIMKVEFEVPKIDKQSENGEAREEQPRENQ